MNRHLGNGVLKGYDRRWHEAADLIVSLGQVIPVLSGRAAHRLRGRIEGGLKTEGLRPLFNEMGAATVLCQLGYDVRFFDLEEGGGFDFLATKQGQTVEVEVKSATAFTGNIVHPTDLVRFHHNLARGFKAPAAGGDAVPIVNIHLSDRLPKTHSLVKELVELCSQVVAHPEDACSTADGTSVHFIERIPNVPIEKITFAAQQDASLNGISVCVLKKTPQVIVRFTSQRPSKLEAKIASSVSEASRRQLSGLRPGIVWTHIDYLEPTGFEMLANSPAGQVSLFDRIAFRAFSSEHRRHVVQLAFTGASFLDEKNGRGRSRFRCRAARYSRTRIPWNFNQIAR